MATSYGDDVTVLKAGTSVNEYGNTVTNDWNNPTQATYSHCAIANPQFVQQFLVGRDVTDVDLVAYLPFDADVTEEDRMIVRGQIYDVNGAFKWSGFFTGREAGIQVQLHLRTG